MPDPALSPSGETPLVLVVDDEEQMTAIISFALETQGLRTLIAADASAARQLLDTEPVELVVLDVMLPGESGIELCRSLRETSDVPVILLTALSDVDDRVAGLMAGCRRLPHQTVQPSRACPAGTGDPAPLDRGIDPRRSRRPRTALRSPAGGPRGRQRELGRYRAGSAGDGTATARQAGSGCWPRSAPAHTAPGGLGHQPRGGRARHGQVDDLPTAPADACSGRSLGPHRSGPRPGISRARPPPVTPPLTHTPLTSSPRVTERHPTVTVASAG